MDYAKKAPLSCPSAMPSMPDAAIFGVVAGTAESARVEYLAAPVPVTRELLRSLGTVRPGEVLRIRGECANSACVHHTEQHCTLGQRVAALPHDGATKLPPCAIRPTCRWFAEQGKRACVQCPKIATEVMKPVARLDLRVYLPVLNAYSTPTEEP